MGVELAGRHEWDWPTMTPTALDALGRIHAGEPRSRRDRIVAWLRRVLG